VAGRSGGRGKRCFLCAHYKNRKKDVGGRKEEEKSGEAQGDREELFFHEGDLRKGEKVGRYPKTATHDHPVSQDVIKRSWDLNKGNASTSVREAKEGRRFIPKVSLLFKVGGPGPEILSDTCAD